MIKKTKFTNCKTMNRSRIIGSFVIGLTLISCEPQEEPKEVSNTIVQEHQQSTATYAADIPDYLITPNSVQTKYAGEL